MRSMHPLLANEVYIDIVEYDPNDPDTLEEVEDASNDSETRLAWLTRVREPQNSARSPRDLRAC